MVLTGQSAEQDDAEERLHVTAEGSPVSVGFNAGYLVEAINHVSGSELRLSFTPAGNSCLVEDPDDPRYRCVVMPMRL
jgi:DNA polymerase-3 subunit beta